MEIRVDSFHFNEAFPHRVPGVYKLRWYSHDTRIGRTLKFRLLGRLGGV